MLCLSGFELYSRWVPLNFQKEKSIFAQFTLAIREKNKIHSAYMYLISVRLTHRFHLSPGSILKTILLDLVFVISRIIKVEVSVKSSESTTAADNTY